MSRFRAPRTASLVAGAVLLGAVASALAAPGAPPPGRAERIEHRDPAMPPAIGPAGALVTIEVFFVPGPNMPAGALRLLRQLQDRHPTRIRLVYRILKSGSALLVPSAALEAHAQGKFFELMDELGKQRTPLKKEDLLELARRIGLDPQRAGAATGVARYRDVLEANQRRFERLHGGSTPSVLFNARAPKLSLGGVSAADLDREYEAAYGRAIDKLDRGFAPGELAEAFEDEATDVKQPAVMSLGASDDDSDASPLDRPLARPPLSFAGLPSFGKPGVTARVPILVLCRPTDASCGNLLRVTEPEARLFPDQVRVVWAPWFDVGRDDATELSLLADAALCADAVGSNQADLTMSPGWLWVKEMYAQASRGAGKKLDPEALIDKVARKLDVDVRALSACRARTAGGALRWIEAARHAGVRRTASAVVIGGRIYEGLTDQSLIRQLVEAELAPGVLGSLPRWHTDK